MPGGWVVWKLGKSGNVGLDQVFSYKTTGMKLLIFKIGIVQDWEQNIRQDKFATHSTAKLAKYNLSIIFKQ
jgi:hypothetical protein